MKKHNIALTYEPKIEAVIDGRCRQTIRRGSRFEVGDLISFHGWEGVPYRSKWSFSTRYFELKEVTDISVNKELGICISNDFYGWFERETKWIACADHIDPPTGEALRDVLFGLNAKQGSHFDAQIIRW